MLSIIESVWLWKQKTKMYVANDYGYENYEESGGQREGDPENGMQKFIEDLDEKHTTLNQNEKKTQNLIKILITVAIFIFMLLLSFGIIIGYHYVGNNTITPGKKIAIFIVKLSLSLFLSISER